MNLKQNEHNLILELKKQSELWDERNELRLKQLCSENRISHSKYASILNQYKTNIQFQRSLKPHFDAYLKQKK